MITNPIFLIPVSLQPDVLDISYFKLRLFDLIQGFKTEIRAD